MEQDEYDTAARASIGDVADRTARADAQVKKVLERVLAQRRSAAVASGYVAALSPRTRANCWSLAESAGHQGWGRMQALLGSYRWDWKDLRAQLPGLAAAWIPDADGDLIGAGIAIDETAHLKHGDATAPIRLSITETVRLAGLARQYAAGLISRARLAFALHWSLQRRRHQAIARWHHHSARLLAITSTG